MLLTEWFVCILFFVKCYCDHLDRLVLTHAVPTRRSSAQIPVDGVGDTLLEAVRRRPTQLRLQLRRVEAEVGAGLRSEEHTSELQSLMRISYAVFGLKNKIHTLLTSRTHIYTLLTYSYIDHQQ